MRFIKFLLLIVLMVVGVGAAVVIVSYHVPQAKLSIPTISFNQLQPFISSAIQNAQANKVSQNIQSWSGKVLGVQDTKQAQQNASLPQKTLEFVRYSYCKEVVKQYEAAQEK